MSGLMVQTSEPGKQIGVALGNGGVAGPVNLEVVRGTHLVYIKYTGVPTAPSIQTQGSLNGTDWYNMGSAYTATSNGAIVLTTGTLAQYVRVNVTVGVATVDVFLGSL